MPTLLDSDFMRKLEQLELVSRKVFTGKIRGERRSRKLGFSVEFADFRPYAPGDDTRFVDWRAFGRLDKLFLKLFMEEEDLFVYLLIDTSHSMAFGDPSKILYAKKIAAALGYIALANLDRVSMDVFSSGLLNGHRPIRGKQQVFQLFDFLEKIECEGETSLEKTCKEFAYKNKRRGVVVVLSDFFDRNGYEGALKYLKQRNFDVCCFHLLSPEEVEPEMDGDWRLVDIEDAQFMDVTAGPTLIRTYKRNLADFCHKLRTYCSQNNYLYVSAVTSMPFEELVMRYLREKRLVR